MTATVADFGYRPGLDGVRGIAILLVLVYHSSLLPIEPLATGGVTIFFVLSGYLITRLLLEERARTSRIDVWAFYGRRAARLLPALVLMLAVFTALVPSQWWSAAWALSYSANWAMAARWDVGMYGFTWTLAIEEQFYLLWPAALLFIRRPAAILILIAGLLIARQLPQSAEFADFSTLSHAPSLLMGAWMAFRTRAGRRISAIWLLIATLAALLAYVLTLAIGVRLQEQVWAALGAVLVTTALAGSFAWRPLSGLGRISYGVYLWHLPVLVVIGADGGSRGPIVGVAACVAAIGIAYLSYRFVERPILRWASERSRDRSTRRENLQTVPGLTP